MEDKIPKRQSIIIWNSTAEKLPPTHIENIRNEVYDKAYLLWCKNYKGEEYIDPSTFVLEGSLDSLNNPTMWVGYQGGEFACIRKLEDVLYWAELPKIK